MGEVAGLLLKPLAGCPLRVLVINDLPKLVDLQDIPDYFPDLEELSLHESFAKPELITRLKNLKKLTVFTDQAPRAKVVPVDSFKK